MSVDRKTGNLESTFIELVKRGRIDDALDVLEDIPTDFLEKQLRIYDFRSILYRGNFLTKEYVDSHIRFKLDERNNLVYLVVKSGDPDLLRAFLEKILNDFEPSFDDDSDEAADNEFKSEMILQDIVSFTLSSFIYQIAPEEQMMDVLFDVFKGTAFELLYNVYNQAGAQFEYVRTIIRNYFSYTKIRRIFKHLEIEQREYDRLFRFIEGITGITSGQYIAYLFAELLELEGELSDRQIPAPVKRIIGDYL